MLGCIKGGQAFQSGVTVKIADVIQPAVTAGRVSRNAQECDKDVDRGRCQHGTDKDPMKLILFEAELLRKMRDVFKADKGPRRDEGDPQCLRQGALFRHKGRGPAPRVRHRRHGKAYADAYGKNRHQCNHYMCGSYPASDA